MGIATEVVVFATHVRQPPAPYNPFVASMARHSEPNASDPEKFFQVHENGHVMFHSLACSAGRVSEESRLLVAACGWLKSGNRGSHTPHKALDPKPLGVWDA